MRMCIVVAAFLVASGASPSFAQSNHPAGVTHVPQAAQPVPPNDKANAQNIPPSARTREKGLSMDPGGKSDQSITIKRNK